MGDEGHSEASRRAICTLPVIASLALMIANDHLLKHTDLLPGWLTGKLSDFAFLFFAPIVLAFVCRARTRVATGLCYAVPAALLTAINLSPSASDAFTAAMSTLCPMHLVPDPWDLLALAILPVSWRWLRAASRRPTTTSGAPAKRVFVAAIAAVACVATSPAIQPTHRPIYMSWDELRSTAVAVEPPRPIGTRGKMVVAREHIFISEPGQGVHIVDNRDPRAPRQIAFIRVPGNIDIAVEGDLLFADSFVDLLTFELDLEAGSAVLIGRLEDQFDYDPWQALPADEEIRLDQVDRDKGVVVGAAPIAPAGAAGQRGGAR